MLAKAYLNDFLNSISVLFALTAHHDHERLEWKANLSGSTATALALYSEAIHNLTGKIRNVDGKYVILTIWVPPNSSAQGDAAAPTAGPVPSSTKVGARFYESGFHDPYFPLSMG